MTKQIQIRHTKDGSSAYQMPFQGWTEISLPEGSANTELQIVNQLLAQERCNARPYEANHLSDKDSKMFLGAALLKTKDGRYYLSNNSHITNSSAYRSCAELKAAESARVDTPDNLEVSDLWYMGGISQLDNVNYISDDEQGHRATPCGTCRDMLLQFGLKDGDTMVHMLPLNDGSMALEAGGPDLSQLRDNQPHSLSIKALLPHAYRFAVSDTTGALRQRISEGLKWLTSENRAEAIINATNPQQQPLDTLCVMEKENASPESIQAEINRIMMERLHEESKKQEPELKRGSIAIVRTKNGEYFMGTHFEDGKTLSTFDAEYNAIQNMQRDQATDVFILDVDLRKGRPYADMALEGHSSETTEIPMPDGDMRERIKKARVKDGNIPSASPHWTHALQSKQQVEHSSELMVHIMTPHRPKARTDENDYDPKMQMQSFSIDELLPFAYRNPKWTEEIRHSDGHSLCC